MRPRLVLVVVRLTSSHHQTASLQIWSLSHRLSHTVSTYSLIHIPYAVFALSYKIKFYFLFLEYMWNQFTEMLAMRYLGGIVVFLLCKYGVDTKDKMYKPWDHSKRFSQQRACGRNVACRLRRLIWSPVDDHHGSGIASQDAHKLIDLDPSPYRPSMKT